MNIQTMQDVMSLSFISDQELEPLTQEEKGEHQEYLLKFGWLNEPHFFDDYDEPYWIIKCYYRDILGFNLVLNEGEVSDRSITLERDGCTVELIGNDYGWYIFEDGIEMTEYYYLEISKMPEILSARHPKNVSIRMDFHDIVNYHNLKNRIEDHRRRQSIKDRTKTYLILNTENGLYKIGKSVDPNNRLSQLQGMAGAKLTVISTIGRDIERYLHGIFSDYQHHGEWFNDKDGLIMLYFKEFGCKLEQDDEPV